MRIHLFGAVLAFDYMLAGWLRQRGVDAHYFFNLKRNAADYPWWEDAGFDRAHMPEWCHYHPFSVPYLYNAPLGAEGRRFVRDYNAGADLLFAVGDGALLAQHYRKPHAIWSCGFEVEAAVPAPIRWRALAGRFAGGREPVNLQRALNYRHVRRNLRNADSVISVMEWQVSTLLAEAGVRDNVHTLPMLYDASRYQPSPDPELIRRFAGVDAVFFLPTRHSYRTFSTNDKGADKVVRAFARMARDTSARVMLVLVEKGERVAESRALLEQEGVADRTLWLPPLRKDELKAYYSLPNVVVLDQFQNEETLPPALYTGMRRYGARGSIFAEAMCIGAPLITNAGTQWIREHGADTLVWDACTTDEIYAALRAAAGMPSAERAARALTNRQWAHRRLHWESGIDAYITHFETILRGRAGRRVS